MVRFIESLLAYKIKRILSGTQRKKLPKDYLKKINTPQKPPQKHLFKTFGLCFFCVFEIKKKHN
jgi:hypothetical protein